MPLAEAAGGAGRAPPAAGGGGGGGRLSAPGGGGGGPPGRAPAGAPGAPAAGLSGGNDRAGSGEPTPDSVSPGMANGLIGIDLGTGVARGGNDGFMAAPSAPSTADSMSTSMSRS